MGFRRICGKPRVPGAVCPDSIRQSSVGISRWCEISKQLRIERLRLSRAIFFKGFSGEVCEFLLRGGKQIGPASFGRQFVEYPTRKSILILARKPLGLCKCFPEQFGHMAIVSLLTAHASPRIPLPLNGVRCLCRKSLRIIRCQRFQRDGSGESNESRPDLDL